MPYPILLAYKLGTT